MAQRKSKPKEPTPEEHAQKFTEAFDRLCKRYDMEPIIVVQSVPFQMSPGQQGWCQVPALQFRRISPQTG